MTSSESFAERWKNTYKTTGRLPSAYLFAGPVGSGRLGAALQIIKSLLGRTENHSGLIRIQPEKGSIKVETIRDLIRRLSLKPLEGDRIVILMEEAETMTLGAANSLLKTLEEPPSSVLFILLTAAPEVLPSTIRSRCQKVLFQMTEEKIKDRLGEIYPLWEKDILPFLSSPPSFSRASQLAESIAKEHDEQIPSLFELLRSWWHDLAVYRQTGDNSHLLFSQALPSLKCEADRREVERIFEEFDLIQETEYALEGNVNKTLALERLFVKLMPRPSPLL